ncbi:zinc finger protein 37 homolog [Phlebotomus argentipes]|uniref:zinc finger protein 37 homolog n=1 Tax=Phlebotomus argentipes TaxID=94469 RepID=UPI0028937BE8|nr:zinc finger protein 37 homolog [Phlebotomus argentipes]
MEISNKEGLYAVESSMVKEEFCVEVQGSQFHYEHGYDFIKAEAADVADEVMITDVVDLGAYVKSEDSHEFVQFDVTEIPPERSNDVRKSHRKKYCCPVCNKSCKGNGGLKNHLVMHKDHQFYYCGYCAKIFEQKSEMEKHLEKHKSKKRCTCNECNQEVKISSAVQGVTEHVEDVEEEIQFLPSDSRHAIVEYHPTNSYKCCTCGDTFKLLRDIKIHMKSHPIIHQIRQDKFKCPYCEDGFVKILNLELHMSKYHRGLPCNATDPPLTCTVCKKAFESLDCLKKHVKIHSITKSFKCGYCERKCDSTNKMIIHVSDDHPGKRLPRGFPDVWMLYTCALTGKTFPAIQHAKRSAKEVTNLRKRNKTRYLHACRFCGEKLLRKDLKKHENEHKSDKGVKSLFSLLKKVPKVAQVLKNEECSESTTSSSITERGN